MNIGNMAKGMNHVERLAIDHGGASLLVPDRNGEFIRYTDYAEVRRLYQAEISALQQQLAAAREALQAAEADAARYRWLRDEADKYTVLLDPKAKYEFGIKIKAVHSPADEPINRDFMIDAAIDAALATLQRDRQT